MPSWPRLCASCRVSQRDHTIPPILKWSFPGAKGEGFGVGLPSSTGPGVPAAISGLCLFGHQVAPLVSCISVVIENPAAEAERQEIRSMAWERHCFSSLWPGDQRPPKLNDLNQQPLLFTSSLGWLWGRHSVGLARGDSHSCSHLLAYLGLTWD